MNLAWKCLWLPVCHMFTCVSFVLSATEVGNEGGSGDVAGYGSGIRACAGHGFRRRYVRPVDVPGAHWRSSDWRSAQTLPAGGRSAPSEAIDSGSAIRVTLDRQSAGPLIHH